jgi:hypothetical protein
VKNNIRIAREAAAGTSTVKTIGAPDQHEEATEPDAAEADAVKSKRAAKA